MLLQPALVLLLARFSSDDPEEPEDVARPKGMTDFARANAARWRWMGNGADKLRKLRDGLASGTGSYDVTVLSAVQSFMHLVPDEPSGHREPTTAELDAIIAKFEGNRDKTGVDVTVAPREDPVGCSAHDIACALGSKIHLMQKWVDAPATCQDTVLAHEYFHTTGHVDLPDEKKCMNGKGITMSDALRSADCLAGLACALDQGEVPCNSPC